MTISIVVLLVIVVLLAAAAAIQHAQIVTERRTTRGLKKGVGKEREATAAILRLTKEVIAARDKEHEFLPHFIRYAVRSMKATGGAMLLSGEDGYFYGCAVSGTLPPIRDVSPQISQQLTAYDRKHTEFIRGSKINFKAEELRKACGEDGFVFFDNKNPPWFPETFQKDAPRCLVAPIVFKDEVYGCIIVVSKNDFDAHQLTVNDGYFLVRLAETASLSIEVIKVFSNRQEYEEKIQAAREEGMMQVSTGIIHNIGNAVTIANLSVSELQSKLNIKSQERPENLILDEMLPRLREKIRQGKAEEFLSSDPAGSQYVTIMTELLSHLRETIRTAGTVLHSLSGKLFHISEIIELQQRFVGELGTENMTQLSNVVDASVLIFEESFNKRGIAINTQLDRTIPEMLIDSSMITQVIINIIKNSVEAMDDGGEGRQHRMDIALRQEKRNGEQYAVMEIKDNGPGIPDDIREKVFDFGFSTKNAGNSKLRGYGLHFCVNTVKKYNGTIEVDSRPGEGAAFRVCLPLSRKVSNGGKDDSAGNGNNGGNGAAA